MTDTLQPTAAPETKPASRWRVFLDRWNDGAENGEGASELKSAFASWDAGEPGEALEQLQGVLAAEQDPERKDLLRRVMVAIFTELGTDHPLAREHRRRLAAALN